MACNDAAQSLLMVGLTPAFSLVNYPTPFPTDVQVSVYKPDGSEYLLSKFFNGTALDDAVASNENLLEECLPIDDCWMVGVSILDPSEYTVSFGGVTIEDAKGPFPLIQSVYDEYVYDYGVSFASVGEGACTKTCADDESLLELELFSGGGVGGQTWTVQDANGSNSLGDFYRGDDLLYLSSECISLGNSCSEVILAINGNAPQNAPFKFSSSYKVSLDGQLVSESDSYTFASVPIGSCDGVMPCPSDQVQFDFFFFDPNDPDVAIPLTWSAPGVVEGFSFPPSDVARPIHTMACLSPDVASCFEFTLALDDGSDYNGFVRYQLRLGDTIYRDTYHSFEATNPSETTLLGTACQDSTSTYCDESNAVFEVNFATADVSPVQAEPIYFWLSPEYNRFESVLSSSEYFSDFYVPNQQYSVVQCVPNTITDCYNFYIGDDDGVESNGLGLINDEYTLKLDGDLVTAEGTLETEYNDTLVTPVGCSDNSSAAVFFSTSAIVLSFSTCLWLVIATAESFVF